MASPRTPPDPTPAGITPLMRERDGGDHATADRLVRPAYAELHRQAARAMRGQAVGHALQTTAFVHEACSRLVALRYFGGLTEAETAGAPGASRSTVGREWATTRAGRPRELAAP